MKSISRTTINFWLDLSLLVLFLVLTWSAVVLEFVFPPGPSSDGWQLWGWDYVSWRRFQFATHASLALGVLLHVMLHWSWVCGVVAKSRSHRDGRVAPRRDDGSRTLWGVALLIVIVNLIGLAVAASVLSIEPGDLAGR